MRGENQTLKNEIDSANLLIVQIRRCLLTKKPEILPFCEHLFIGLVVWHI